jgi:hypothetical protein
MMPARALVQDVAPAVDAANGEKFFGSFFKKEQASVFFLKKEAKNFYPF